MALRAFERRWLETVFVTILPDGAVPDFPRVTEVPWDAFLDDLTRAAPRRMLIALELALWFVVLLAPLLVLGRLRTFAGLTGEERLRLLRELRTSRFYVVRELVVLKSIACLGYCGLPAVRRRMGMAGDAEPPPWARPSA
jgi:hypothetical protein